MTKTNRLKAIQNYDLGHSLSRFVYDFFENYRLVFVLAFALNIFAYFIFIAHHPLHNHGFRMPWITPTDQIHHGRWFNYFILKFTNAADIPVFLPVLSIFFGVLTGILLLKIWQFNLSKIENFIVIGLLTTFPAFLAVFYFTFSTPLFLISNFFAVLSVYLGGKLKIKSLLFSAVFFMLALATYQPSISVFAVVAGTGLIVAALKFDEHVVKRVFNTGLAYIVSAFAGGLGYILSIKITNANSYAVKTTELSDIPMRLLKVIDVSFNHLTLTQPDILNPVKQALLLLLIFAFIATLILVRKSIVKILIVCVIGLALVPATKAMYIISQDTYYFQYRYNLSLAFLYAFGAACLFHAVKIKAIRSLALVLCSFILLRFVQADLIRQEVVLRGQQHDLALTNRILMRIESLPDLDTDKSYDLVRIGKYSNFRQTILSSKNHKAQIRGDGHLDIGEITDLWADEDVFILLGSKVKFKNRGYDRNSKAKIKKAREEFLPGRKVWPHKDSVFIQGDIIYVYMQ